MTLDKRPRFDLQSSHLFEKPIVNGVQSPEEISNDFTKVMRQATDIDYCSELIGSALLF